jgi:hypothetical protein
MLLEITFPRRPSHMRTLPPCERCGAVRWVYVSADHWERNVLTCDECNDELALGRD